MWPGATVAILASGPSMNADVCEQVRLAGVQSIAINNTFRLAPFADVLYAADARWWDVHRDDHPKRGVGWRSFAGMKVTVMPTPHEGIHQLTESGATGFDDDPARLRTGHNSGYQAIHFAVHAGAARILLCGMDMAGKHWHPEHEHPLRNNEDSFFIRCLICFKDLAVELKKRNVEVWNCTPGSALKSFPSMDLADALARSAKSEAA